jgi:hypothetical protein
LTPKMSFQSSNTDPFVFLIDLSKIDLTQIDQKYKRIGVARLE